MSRLFATLVVVGTTLGAVNLPVSAQELPASMVNALRQAKIPVRSVGVFVQQVDTAQPVLAASAATAFSPASVMKLVTTDAALELLGPTYSWKTQAFIDGALQNGVLSGDLSIKGSGDPKLVMENFWMFLRQIRAKGVRDIRGNLVLDRSIFAEQEVDPAQFDDDPQKPYNVGPDALLLNYKTIALHFLPDESGKQVVVSVEPPLAGYVVNPPKLSADVACGDWRTRLKADVGDVSTSFAGSYPAACGEQVWYINPYRMSANQYFGAVFRQMWAELGGTFSGQVVAATVAPAAHLLAEWQSPTVPEVIRDINKYSNNVMARQLLLTMAAQAAEGPGNVARGAQTISAWLSSKGIASNAVIIDNGAGLSRTERITPAILGQLLLTAYHSAVMPEFIASLPLVGYDGTMRKRLRSDAVAGQAHIKTGSLNEVRSVAGYVQAASGKMYVVVCLINHPNAAAGQPAQDALLQWVFQNG
ncbi:D-alanyl-D-alanine carboxypeptidase/D-alanyl-D-alanine-endopeptidase (penicillin-binding protein 4) [Herbaspirillum sp. Sphag64]|uniref:D-alanyl-D-alanine carboxypeptidase/D-alanyl-D-alanine endopeptidase n=1 Tax=unclassified Herbaspirillum TaxID=2624150 RepID=UPI00161FF08D|nr:MULTISPECIES: D-alanyl-D-alanine carboxypeptidase/D-alanyl-D-alanine-endopeptidase [unclassified Herbaspirillum]MBB3245142.1 D-alanyl-D-alanine carboxypeptidase/D-alanyl-D-alanine-endopeptidase (penicillin-binding protein 4) [Herbaspirillum sp. Sphag64]